MRSKTNNKEKGVLREAEAELFQLAAAEKTISERGKSVVDQEAEVVKEALKLLRALVSISGPPPALEATDVQRRAVLLLSISAFNALVVAWDSLVRGYYSVGLGFFRFFPETILYLQAVALDRSAAQKWMDGTLNDTLARRVVARGTAKDGVRRASDAKNPRKVEKFIQESGHASQAVARGSAAIYSDHSGADLRVGPYWNEKYYRLIALYIADAAIDCAFWAGFALQESLDEGGPLTLAAKSLTERRGLLATRLTQLQTI